MFKLELVFTALYAPAFKKSGMSRLRKGRNRGEISLPMVVQTQDIVALRAGKENTGPFRAGKTDSTLKQATASR